MRPMGIIEPILEEFTQESANTRRILTRVPEEHFAWKPHAKSMPLGHLASHLAEIPQWVGAILTQEEIDIDPETYSPWRAKSQAEMVEAFDGHVAKAKEAMAGQADDALLTPWRLKMKGQVRFEMPRCRVLRGMILNHSIHHRGQLEVYLRLKDVPLPAIYGPSADEEP